MLVVDFTLSHELISGLLSKTTHWVEQGHHGSLKRKIKEITHVYPFSKYIHFLYSCITYTYTIVTGEDQLKLGILIWGGDRGNSKKMELVKYKFNAHNLFIKFSWKIVH